MLTASVDMTGFNAGIAGLQRALGVSARVIVEKEAGELIKTLVRISPPERQQRSNESIAKNLSSKFDQASRVSYFDSRTDPGAIKWTGANKQFLYGVANENDLRSVGDVKQIAKLSHRITSKGRTVYDFKSPRKRQKVALNQRIFLRAGMLTKVIKYFQRNVGRLKAGWLVASNMGVVKLSGRAIPQWITRHSKGARGRVVENNLNNAAAPAITISNFAKGIGAPGVNALVSDAVKIRAKAMADNAARILAGKSSNYLSSFK